ncbi:LRR receptor-like serine/threonine-protein kinase ERL1 [Cryptomeria japonica]|uniref:LRR receptor-like serine/threonine-protein kinase ERL1 n=1 Tax=Cryptomeria japonica TaxID=3369 RepID=UPI0027DA9095|nr:LRR receptor-like serine/threonine-protein kinase ERL1 [Cryptomeria japonica]
MKVVEREREALIIFKHALNYSSDFYTNLSSWEKERDCCVWDGISCHNTTHHVVSVEIYGGLEIQGGVISESLCTLTFVATIRLTSTGLTGTIPLCLGKLSSLTELDLTFNRLRGNITLPSSLTVLYLRDNVLEGETVLSTICMLSNLRKVDLTGNQLNGNLPSCLGRLSSLIELDLSGNGLSGNIPLSFGNLSSSLAILGLADNVLEGENVLTTICMLSNLNEIPWGIFLCWNS